MATRDGITRMVSDRTGKVSYRARISFTGPDGSRLHRSKSFGTKKAAQAWLNDRRREIDRDEYQDPSPALLSDVAERWLASIDRTRAASTAMHYRRWYERIVVPQFGSRKIASIRATEIQAFYDGLVDRYRGGTIGMIHKVLRGILAYAVTDGLIRANPADGRRIDTSPTVTHTVWTPDQARAFMDHIAPDVRGPLFIFLLATGVRLGEALALHWEDVDLDARTARIHRTVQHTYAGPVVADTTKTASSTRTIVLPAVAAMALRRQPQGSSYVFPNSIGGITAVSRVRDDLKRLCDAANVPRVTPHDFRRMAATMMQRHGVPVSVAARQMGHSVELMLARYVSVSTDMQDAAADAIDAALTSNRSPDATTQIES